MIKFEQIEVWGIKHAIRGMRNPLNSWERSDTVFDGDKMCLGGYYRSSLLVEGVRYIQGRHDSE